MDGNRFDRLVASLDGANSRRGVVKALGGGIAAAALATVGARSAAARPAQNVFVDNCRETGGTSKRIRTKVVRCTYNDSGGHGWYEQHNFLTHPPTCHEVSF